MAVEIDEVWVPMRDGIRLFSKLFRPAGTDLPLPAVLMRNPYNSGIAPPIWDGMCEELAARGYAVINQDVRGTNRSEGELTPFFQEAEDGYDAVEWTARQAWCNGKVGLWGISYLGVCAMQAATLRPPHLVAVAAEATASNYYDHWVYENGFVNSLFISNWTSGLALDAAWRREGGKKIATQEDQLEWPSFYQDWMAHPVYDDYWRQVDLTERCREIDVPVLLRGGWFDLFAKGTIELFRGLSTRPNDHLGSVTRLEMNPGCHGPWTSTDLEFPEALGAMPDMAPAWWDRWLKDEPEAEATGSAVRLYVMAPPLSGSIDEGFWIELPSFPDTPTVSFALAGADQDADKSRAGRLIRGGSSTGRPDKFIHDPANPVPTRGGPIGVTDPETPPGVVEQASLIEREDVLTYNADILTEPLTLLGQVKAIFWASSTSANTQFAVKLSVERPDGTVFNFLDRMVSAHTPDAQAGQGSDHGICRCELNLGYIALMLRAGMRLILQISSSNYPRFVAGTSQDPSTAVAGKQIQTIYHDADHPSRLELMVAG